MNWDNKSTWRGLLAGLAALGIIWISVSRVPAEEALARSPRPPAPQVGFAAPDFTLETCHGKTINLADLRGQVVLVVFWATWCPHCRAEMPAIQQVYEGYRDQGFTVLAVDVGEREAQVAAFAGDRGLTFPILMDRDEQVASRYHVRAMPAIYFVDRAGVIQEVSLGSSMTEDFIESQVVGLLGTAGSE